VLVVFVNRDKEDIMVNSIKYLGIPMKTTSIEHGLNGLDGLTRVFSFLKII
jgi:hypothetical protein